MQQAIRALGWATKILWVILITIVITIGYSATQINIAFGETTTTVTEQTVTISMPINIHNAGLYDINQLNITTRIQDHNGNPLVTDSTLTRIIPKRTDATTTHTVTLNITKMLTQQNNTLLFNDANLIAFQYVAFSYANAIPLSVHANYTMQWGAPLSNLVIGNPTYQAGNSTSRIIVQISFENHNQYVPVTGIMRVEVYNSHGTLKGTGTADINAQPYSSCSTQVSVLVSNFRTLPASGAIHVYFETSVFNYGPRVVLFGP
ncbi:MAG TPA: hypothetical protein VMS95_03340 [Candidatus Krumholzibacteriaceae bacterium]|nr:hypothetical protein [Candidatus Krumholzibacteriaceae bacterium]